MITVAASTMTCVAGRCYPDTWSQTLALCADVVVLFVLVALMGRVLAARNAPAARRRRTLTLLHRLGAHREGR